MIGADAVPFRLAGVGAECRCRRGARWCRLARAGLLPESAFVRLMGLDWVPAPESLPLAVTYHSAASAVAAVTAIAQIKAGKNFIALFRNFIVLSRTLGSRRCDSPDNARHTDIVRVPNPSETLVCTALVTCGKWTRLAWAPNLLALADDYPEQGRCQKRRANGEEDERQPLRRNAERETRIGRRMWSAMNEGAEGGGCVRRAKRRSEGGSGVRGRGVRGESARATRARAVARAPAAADTPRGPARSDARPPATASRAPRALRPTRASSSARAAPGRSSSSSDTR